MSLLKSKLAAVLSLSFSVLAAVGYGGLARLVFGDPRLTNLSGGLGTVSLAFLFFVPLAIGAIKQLFAAPAHQRAWWHAVFAPWIPATICLILASLLAWELVICIVLAAPIFYSMSSVGGFIVWLVFYLSKKQEAHKTPILAIILLLPYFVTPIESLFAPRNDVLTVESTIVINATPEIVWQNIIRFRLVNENEAHNALFTLAGLPRPLQATLDYERVGAIRRGYWEDGLAFDGLVVEWVPNERYRLILHADTRAVRSNWVPLEEIGGRYFDMVDDSYIIERLDNTRVRLHLLSTYRMTTRLNAYGTIWGNLFLRDIQEYILGIERERCEAQAALR